MYMWVSRALYNCVGAAAVRQSVRKYLLRHIVNNNPRWCLDFSQSCAPSVSSLIVVVVVVVTAVGNSRVVEWAHLVDRLTSRVACGANVFLSGRTARCGGRRRVTENSRQCRRLVRGACVRCEMRASLESRAFVR